jgi:hypothetical protein
VIGLARAVVLAAGLLGRHDVHVSHTRLVVEGATVAAQVRLFRDDLEKTLRVDAATVPRRDSLLGAYLDRTFVLEADGVRLRGTVEGSGIEKDRDQQDVVWVLLDFPAARAVTAIRLRNVIFMETWGDQQNIVQVLHLPGEGRHTLYFAPGDGRAQALEFP